MSILTKSTIAATFLALLAGVANAQSGDSRQIQVLPAPAQQQVAQAQAVQEPASAADASTQPELAQPPEAQASQEAPQTAPKIAPSEARPAPKFAPVPPKFTPQRPAYAEGYGYERNGYASYGSSKRYRNHCH